MPVIHLTNEIIPTLSCPEGTRRVEYCDGQNRDAVPGLYIEVRNTSPGQGTYYLRYKDPGGKTCHQKIGRTTDIDLATARERARALRAQITLGANPREEAKARKAVPTLANFFIGHYLPFAKLHKRSWQKDQSMFDIRIKPAFGEKRLNQITRQQAQAFHTGLKQQGLSGATCDHHLKLLRRCLNLAVEWELLDNNPLNRIRLFREPNQVETYVDENELQRLLKVLRTDKNRTVCSIALFLLSTGARLNEALRAEWQHIDREHRVWRIPASNAKSKKVRAVPLNDAAIAVLDSQPTKRGVVFQNPSTKTAYTTIHKVWERLRMEAGLPHLRIHDLRHSYASFLVNAGHSLYSVQALLGHGQPQVTQRYAHLSTRTLQDAANAASATIARATEQPTEQATD